MRLSILRFIRPRVIRNYWTSFQICGYSPDLSSPFPYDENLFHKIFDIGYRVHNEATEAIARRDRASTRRAIALEIRATFLNTPILQNGKVDEINTFLTRLK